MTFTHIHHGRVLQSFDLLSITLSIISRLSELFFFFSILLDVGGPWDL